MTKATKYKITPLGDADGRYWFFAEYGTLWKFTRGWPENRRVWLMDGRLYHLAGAGFFGMMVYRSTL